MLLESVCCTLECWGVMALEQRWEVIAPSVLRQLLNLACASELSFLFFWPIKEPKRSLVGFGDVSVQCRRKVFRFLQFGGEFVAGV